MLHALCSSKSGFKKLVLYPNGPHNILADQIEEERSALRHTSSREDALSVTWVDFANLAISTEAHPPA